MSVPDSPLQRLRSRVRDFLAAQRQLHDSYVNRYVASGQEAVVAMRLQQQTLHWQGDRLVGDFLPGTERSGRSPGDDSHLWI